MSPALVQQGQNFLKILRRGRHGEARGAALRAALFARVVLFAKENHPCATPRERKGCALDLPVSAPAGTMLHALCKGLLAKQGAAFDLLCSLPPLPLCGGVSFPLPRLSTGRSVVSDRTHMSFRTRSAAAAERSKKHTKSSEVPAPPYCSQKVGFPRQFGGQGACPLLSLGVPKGIFSSTKRMSPLILRRGVRRKRRRAGAARGRVVDLGTATRETGGKAGYAENMSRAAAVNAQRERVLLFSLSSFCDPFQAARL